MECFSAILLFDAFSARKRNRVVHWITVTAVAFLNATLLNFAATTMPNYSKIVIVLALFFSLHRLLYTSNGIFSLYISIIFYATICCMDNCWYTLLLLISEAQGNIVFGNSFFQSSLLHGVIIAVCFLQAKARNGKLSQATNFKWYTMRRGELAGLTWEDIDFDHCTVHVDKSLLIVNKGYHLTTTKEDNVRDIDVAPEFMEYLKTYRDQWLAQKHRMGSAWQTCMDGKWESYRESLQKLRGKNFIVINDFGWPISPDHYGKIVDRVAEKAGIRKIHPHMFRHTFVSILLSNPDIGVATVAAEAGHAQPSTTLAIYTQVYHKRQDSIRSQMSETLYKRKTPER